MKGHRTPAGGKPGPLAPRTHGGRVLRDVVVREEPRMLRRASARGESPFLVPEPHPDGAIAAQGGRPPGPAAAEGRQAEQPAEASPLFQAGARAARQETAAATERAIESGFRAGFERGFSDGREEGLARGRDEALREAEQEADAAEERVSERLGRLDLLLAALPAELSRRLESASEDVVALCHDVVCRILGEQLVTREGVAAMVRTALTDARGGAGAHGRGPAGTTVHVHPGDLDALRAEWARSGPEPTDRAVRWVADESVEMGGCVISSSDGSLDARLEVQLETLRSVLSRARAERTPAHVSAGEPSTRHHEPTPGQEPRR
jgi:flagellar assembly protein FliH